jgi:parvulin-like peptidyl-prolyl isomerase
MTTQDAPPDQVKMTKQQYKALIEETKRNATRGSAQQVTALNQQVRNLREQLNMALTRIEKYEKQNRSSVRA